MLANFVFNVCHCTGDWKMDSYIRQQTEMIREKVKAPSWAASLSTWTGSPGQAEAEGQPGRAGMRESDETQETGVPEAARSGQGDPGKNPILFAR